MSFADNSTATGGYAPSWTELRFEIVPKGIAAGLGARRIRGVREFTGGGYTIEGVTHVYDASGSGKPAKITRGRQKPNELTLKLDPETYRQHVAPLLAKGLIDLKLTLVGAAGVLSTTEVYEDCTDAGMDPVMPNDGNPIERTIKLMATNYIPGKVALLP